MTSKIDMGQIFIFFKNYEVQGMDKLVTPVAKIGDIAERGKQN